MKKSYIIFFATLSLLLLFSIPTPASADLCADITTGTYTAYDFLQDGNGLVPCGQTPECRCELGHLLIMGVKVYKFLTVNIAAPLAVILIVSGGIMLMLSGGNPNLVTTAKRLFWGAAIGVLLVIGSWVIVDLVFKAIGYSGAWSILSF